MAQHEPCDVSGGIGDAARKWEYFGNYTWNCAARDQQGSQSSGNEPTKQADRIYVTRTRTPVGTAWRNYLANHQGRCGRPRERPRPALYRRENDGRRADQIEHQCESVARRFPGFVALGTRGDAGHRFLRCRWTNGVSDLWRERRPCQRLYLLLRDGFPGVERLAAERVVHR